jgi:hypothetical protein
MKFNIFDQTTWQAAQPSLKVVEEQITNKALGAIGQKIYELRQLKEKIEIVFKTGRPSTDSYRIATELLDHSSAAAKQMQIEIIYTHVECARVIDNINKVLEAWKDNEARKHSWRNLIPLLKELEPYLTGSGRPHFYNRSIDEKVKELIEVKVKGNEAWEVYLASERRAASYKEKFETLQKVINSNDLEYLKSVAYGDEEDSPESHDDDDDDDDADDDEYDRRNDK